MAGVRAGRVGGDDGRPRARRRSWTDVLTEEMLRERYEKRGATAYEIAEEVGCSRPTVLSALRRHGIPVRRAVPRAEVARRPRAEPRNWEAHLSRGVLEELYLGRGLSMAAVAAEVGLRSPADVALALRHFGMPVFPRGARRGPRRLTHAVLQELYVEQRLTEAEIGRRYGCGDRAVSRALRLADIPRRQGGEKDWSGRPPLTEELLRELYLRQRLSQGVIARSLRYSPFKVAQALAEHGIGVEDRGLGPTLFPSRQELPTALLGELYVDQEMTASEIGDMLGADPGTVLDRMHEAGLPVRRAGSKAMVKGATPAAAALERLYADPTVTAILTRFGIERRSAPLPRPDRRRPPSPRLDADLLRALYVDAGLSTRRIELLTGVDQLAVLAQLHDAAIAVRPSTNPRSRAGLVDPEQLRELYVERRMTIAEIAEEIGLPRWTVSRLLRDHAIPTRHRGQRSDRPSNRLRAASAARRPEALNTTQAPPATG